MNSQLINHVMISVTDLEASIKFYESTAFLAQEATAGDAK